ncbi:MAG: NAD(P)/FAD-dependent oxidoreductase, partial [Acidobacteria bacterium]|nr:NAD(P)/FAD-dependent oxidoreductase [Acidobacteriota bacterium]
MGSSRREFVGAAIVGLTPKADRPVAGSFVYESQNIGHELRHRACLRTPVQKQKTTVVIVGGGIAGLSAAWRLAKRGFKDFVVLELERQPGGNSRWGENDVSAYPWAAHYLPLPDTKATLVRELCQDLGLLKDGHWDEVHLCHSPQERLYLHGRWQEGFLPETGAAAKDHEQYRRFEERIE